MTGEYKVFGHYGGRFHFAQVEVEITSTDQSEPSEFAVSILNSHELEYPHKDWQESALIGVKRFASKFQDESEGKHFTIRKILATVVDTEESALELAGWMAAYRALFPDLPVPSIKFTDDWEIEF